MPTLTLREAAKRFATNDNELDTLRMYRDILHTSTAGWRQGLHNQTLDTLNARISKLEREQMELVYGMSAVICDPSIPRLHRFTLKRKLIDLAPTKEVASETKYGDSYCRTLCSRYGVREVHLNSEF